MIRLFFSHRDDSGFDNAPSRIVIHYTANLHGDLALLPRLHTYLRRLRDARADAAQRILINLGESCAPDVWHCAATGGRSVLIGLDGMGYTATVGESLSPADRAKLESHVSMALVYTGRPYVQGDLLFALHPTDGDGHLCVCMTPTREAHLHNRLLTLAPLERGHIGEVVIEGGGGQYRMISSAVYALPADTPPDPTIAGVVDFIVSEARYFQRRQGED